MKIGPLALLCGIVCVWPGVCVLLYHMLRKYGSPVKLNPAWLAWRKNEPIDLSRSAVRPKIQPELAEPVSEAGAMSLLKGPDHVEA
jgi:hypothetical protein